MPTPDMSDPGAANQDWLNQFLTWLGNSGQGSPPGALPNPGANQPYAGAGMSPGGGPGGSQGMPGGGVMNRQAFTPGGPSMGYPALAAQRSQATPQGNPANMPSPASSPMSITNQAGDSVNPHGDAPPDVMSPAELYALQPGGQPSQQPSQANAAPAPVQQSYYPNQGMPFPQDPREVGPENVGNLVPKRLGANPPGPAIATGPIDPSIIARQKIRAAGATTTAAPSRGQVPNLGYYAPTTGVAGRGTWTPYAANDPRVYRGPLSMYGRA